MQRCAFTPYEGNEPYIFISYAHKDSDRVYPILEELNRRGYRVWYDDGIAPGSEWPENIAQHLSGCALTMAFISPSSIASDNCRREVTFALSKRKPFLGIILEPTEMSLGMEMQLSAQQCIMKYSYASDESFYTKVCSCPDLQPCLKPAKMQEQPAPAVLTPAPTPAVPTPAPAPVAAPKPQKEPLQLPAFLQNKKLLGLIAGGLAAVVLLVVLLVAFGGSDQQDPNLNSTGTSTGSGTNASDETVLQYADQTITDEDIAKLSSCTKLEKLQMVNCTIEPGVMKELTLPQTVKEVVITGCVGLEDLQWLTELPALEVLDLQNNGLTDVVIPALNFPKLRYADISGNVGITILSKFSECAALEELDFSETSVSSVDVLEGMSGLKVLRGNNTRVVDLEKLTSLENLRVLEFSGCGIEQILGQFRCLYLEELDFSHNALENMEAFQNCTVLRKVDVSYNNMFDVAPLAKSAATLESLDVSANDPLYDWDLKFISDCQKLTTLRVDGLYLSKLDFLGSNTSITELSAVSCHLYNISALVNVPNLRYLNLANNRINDISVLAGLSQDGLVLDLSLNEYLLDISALPVGLEYGVLNLSGTSLKVDAIPQCKSADLFVHYMVDMEAASALKGEFGHIYIVDAPLDKVVSLENQFGKDKVTLIADLVEYLLLLEEQGIDCTYLYTLLNNS